MNRREFLIRVIELAFAKDLNRSTKKEISLPEYLNSIQAEYDSGKRVVANHDVMTGLKEMSDSKRIADYEMYFPMYKAGEIKYQIPWFLLWINHEVETGASSHPYPENNGYTGGMQRSLLFYSYDYVKNAAEGWKELGRLPQNYSQSKGFLTNDYEEILFAARKISEDANRLRSINPNLELADSYLKAQFLYCSRYSAEQRINHFKKMNPLFAIEQFRRMKQRHDHREME